MVFLYPGSTSGPDVKYEATSMHEQTEGLNTLRRKGALPRRYRRVRVLKT